MSRRLSLPRAFVSVAVALCVLLAGVAPSVSRALAAPGGPLSVGFAHDVCTSEPGGGPAGDGGAGQGGTTHHAACALCVAHGGSHAAPPPSAVRPLSACAAASRPALPGHGAVAAFDWNAAAPRGPPRA